MAISIRKSYSKTAVIVFLLGVALILISILEGKGSEKIAEEVVFLSWAIPLAIVVSILIEPRRIVLTNSEFIFEYYFSEKRQPLSELLSYEYPKRWGRYDFVVYKPGTHYKGVLTPVSICARGMYRNDDKIGLAKELDNLGVKKFAGSKNNIF